MKYIMYMLYKRVEGGQTTLVEEVMSINGVTYNYNNGLMQVVSSEFPDVFFPISHGEYMDFLEALRTSDFVEITGYCGFNEITENDYSYPVQEDTLKDDNDSLILEVKERNTMATFDIR